MSRNDDEDGTDFDLDGPNIESLTLYINPTDLSYHLCITKVTKGNLRSVLQDIIERLDGGEMNVEQEICEEKDILN
jgi:hypothetical protein